MSQKQTTIDDLAGMVKDGFDGVDKRFDGVDKRLDTIEGGQEEIKLKLDKGGLYIYSIGTNEKDDGANLDKSVDLGYFLPAPANHQADASRMVRNIVLRI